MNERIQKIPTPAGSVDTFICHPERGGPWPAVLFYMDAPGIREELYDMARRLASVGYYVVLPNLFYRHGHGTTCPPECTDESTEAFKRMIGLMLSVSQDMVIEDTGALLEFIAGESYAKKAPIGCVGYCMGGGFAVTGASAFPRRFAAAASFYGVPLVNDQPKSPHSLVKDMRARAYFCFGERDALTPLKDITAFKAALDAAQAQYELEIYPGADHGFVFPQRAAYQKPLAERHWERLFELFRATIG